MADLSTIQTGALSFQNINPFGDSSSIPIGTQAGDLSFQNINPSRNSSNPTSRFDSGQYSQQKYNELFHDVDLYLCNSGNFDNVNHYFINPAAVLGLYISDTVNDWIVDGSLTFMYLPEGTPNISKTGNKSNTNTEGIDAAKQNGKVLSSYQFRGDGLDLLRVMIMPRSEPGKMGDGLKINKDDTRWMLSYVFSIYEVEDVNDIPGLRGSYAAYMKCLKLYFHDVRYQMLKTSNLEYSTANSKKTEYVPGLANDISQIGGPPRATKTGIAMAEILNKALANPQTGGCDEFSVDENSSLWDKGESKLFYTSPAQWTAYEDVQYVYAHHVSEKPLKGVSKANDLVLLHTERATTFGLIEPLALTPISDFFEKAGKDQPGELQKEHFFVTSLTEETTEQNVTATFRAPMGGVDEEKVDLKTAKYGQILSYSFVDMSPTVNSNMFLTTPVYSVDVGKREFNVQFTNNDVKSARTAIAETYISELYKRGSSNEKLFLPMLHKNKKDLNIFPTFSLNGDNKVVTQKNGILNLIYTGLFQNACICFKTYGLTLRESGTFIGIDKTTGCENNDYNNKLYGQWFVVKVEHLFEAGAYMNVIYAIKIHRYSELQATFESLLQ
jgi:hypothetical protein